MNFTTTYCLWVIKRTFGQEMHLTFLSPLHRSTNSYFALYGVANLVIANFVPYRIFHMKLLAVPVMNELTSFAP